MIKTETIPGDELPYRVEIDGLKGAAISPARAVIAALRVGGKIPRGADDPKDVAGFLLWNYHSTSGWVQLIRILCNDKFEGELKEGT